MPVPLTAPRVLPVRFVEKAEDERSAVMRTNHTDFLRACAAIIWATTAACSGPGAEPVESSQSALTATLTISGRVQTAGGASVSGVTVTLAGKVWKQLTSASDGTYFFTGLAAGSYSVRPTRVGCAFSPDVVNLNNLKASVTQNFTASGSACTGQAATIHKKAMLLILDPSVPAAGGGTQRLSQFHGWSDPDALTEQYRAWFGTTSNGRVTYEIAVRSLRDEFPLKADGFRYTAATFEACMANHDTCHMPDDVDYLKLLADSTVCDRANAGQIDELWVMGAPYFGFYESRLAGPNGYWYNSPPLDGTTCQKLVPIMGFSYERGLAEMIEDFHHRSESTMARVYGSWEENRMSTNWDKFALVAAQSPAFGYSGCGTAHFAPNSIQDYQYDNATPAQTFCDDFANYPNLHTPSTVLRSITCAEWGCNQVGYQTWWYRHLPSIAGTGPDGKFADWWRYVIDPNAVFLTD